MEFRGETRPDDIGIDPLIQWLQLLYIKSTIYYAIYIKVFSGGIVSYITVSTDNVLSTTNNKI